MVRFKLAKEEQERKRDLFCLNLYGAKGQQQLDFMSVAVSLCIDKGDGFGSQLYLSFVVEE